jgi:ubiquinone biosynthesis protein UbiJ
MIAVQALEKRTAEVADLKARLEALEKRMTKLSEKEMAAK